MAYSNFNNTNVKFLQGTQDNLNALITNGKAIEGAFYLTSDTHRLYVGRKDGNSIIPVAVNEGVVTVEDVANLPSSANAGEFYYVSNGNVLCVYSGTTNGWVQINPDTILKSFDTNTKDTEEVTSVTITNTVEDSKKVYEAQLDIKASNGITLTSTAEIKDSNGNITTPASVTIKGDTYSLSTTITDPNDGEIVGGSAELILAAKNNTTIKDTINIKAGDNVSISSSDSNKIEIAAVDTTLEQESFSITNENEGFGFEFSDTSGITLDATLNPTITVGKTSTSSNGTTVKFENGDATLDVYTQSQTDSKIKEALAEADAMTYKGAVGLNSNGKYALPSENVKVGDTYKVSEAKKDCELPDGTKNVDVKIGDLFIAQGTETEGVITSDLTWDYIPAGNDDTFTYSLTKKTHGIILKENTGEEVGSLALGVPDGETIISLEDDTNDGDNDRTITISHAKRTDKDKTDSVVEEVSSNTTLGSAGASGTNLTIPSQAVTVDDYGHVKTIITTKYKVVDTHNHLSSVTDTASVTSNVASLTTSVLMTDGEEEDDSFAIGSSTLTLTAASADASNKQINVDITWGTF